MPHHSFFFLGLRRTDFFALVLCCGPAFVICFMKRSKRGHASSTNSIPEDAFLESFAMPQPFSLLLPRATIILRPDVLTDKPVMAVLVAEIFATWAAIEHELALLLVRVLGADAAPAIAMHATLTAQHLQTGALQAAAKVALSSDDLDIFQAAMSVAESAQTPRNHLAHWIWGECKERPDLLAIADPKQLKIRGHRLIKAFEEKRWPEEEDRVIDPSSILAYSKSDLTRSLRDLKEALKTVSIVGSYLHFPKLKATKEMGQENAELREATDLVHRTLSEQRLFREALDRIRKGRGSTPPENAGQHRPAPTET